MGGIVRNSLFGAISYNETNVFRCKNVVFGVIIDIFYYIIRFFDMTYIKSTNVVTIPFGRRSMPRLYKVKQFNILTP